MILTTILLKISVSKKYNLFLKEHNCDYLSNLQIQEKKIGVNAINVAPELGYLQTRTTIYLANKFNIKKVWMIIKKY